MRFITYLTLTKNLIEDYFGKSIPVFMDVKITYLCNCRCKFCNLWKREKMKELDYEEHKRLIDQAKDLGVRVISYEGGEPLIRKDLSQILRYAKSKGMMVHVNTNGLLLERRSSEIIQNLDGVTVSIDYFDEEKHDKLRGRIGAYRSAMKGILKVKDKVPMLINATLTKDTTRDDVIKLSKMSEKLGITITFQPVFFLESTEDLTLRKTQVEELVELIIRLKRNGYPIVDLYSYFDLLLGNTKVPCRAGDTCIFVHPDGKISFPCNQWYGRECFVGSIRETPLKDIWHSEKVRKLRINSRSCSLCCFGCTALLSLATSQASCWVDYIKSIKSSSFKF